MSAEILATIASVAAMLVALASGFGWTVSHFSKQIANLDIELSGEIRALDDKMERRFEASERRADHRFARVDERFDRADERFDRVDERFDRVDERFQRLEHELTEVRISVARLEGPRPRLIEVR